MGEREAAIGEPRRRWSLQNGMSSHFPLRRHNGSPLAIGTVNLLANIPPYLDSNDRSSLKVSTRRGTAAQHCTLNQYLLVDSQAIGRWRPMSKEKRSHPQKRETRASQREMEHEQMAKEMSKSAIVLDACQLCKRLEGWQLAKKKPPAIDFGAANCVVVVAV